MARKSKQVYLNPKQLAFAGAPQPTRAWIGGRGSGKTVCIGVSQRQKMGDLPRAKFFFSSSTYNQLLTKTLPPITKIWSEFRILEHIPGIQNGHYVIGKVPPRFWDKPFDEPRKYTNVITFRNGYTIELLSMDRPELARGGSYDGGEIDEGASVKQAVLSEILLPSIRGNVNKFSHWSHQQLSLYSSMPWRADGMYLLEYEDLAKVEPEDYFYIESTTYDNIHVLGAKSIERMKKGMTKNTWDIEVMNKRHRKAEKCFYYAFNDNVHVVDPVYEYGEDDILGIFTLGMKNINSNELLEMSWDFSGWFTGFVLFQEKITYNKITEYMHDAMHVTEDQGVNDLVDMFCLKYAGHKEKFVKIWGEPRGHDKTATGRTLYQQVEDRLRFHGWGVEICVTTAVSDLHENRYELINDFLKEENPDYPKLRMNSENCKDVVIAVHNTEVTLEFKKDKSNEKNRAFNQAHATHYTDMIDYFFQQKHGWKVYAYYGAAGSFAG